MAKLRGGFGPVEINVAALLVEIVDTNEHSNIASCQCISNYRDIFCDITYIIVSEGIDIFLHDGYLLFVVISFGDMFFSIKSH